MKIKMFKHSMTRVVDSGQIELLKSAGWLEQPAKIVKAGEDVIRLKPPVKPKATETALEEAKPTLDKGDE
jgi:hypothetical protein